MPSNYSAQVFYFQYFCLFYNFHIFVVVAFVSCVSWQHCTYHVNCWHLWKWWQKEVRWSEKHKRSGDSFLMYLKKKKFILKVCWLRHIPYIVIATSLVRYQPQSFLLHSFLYCVPKINQLLAKLSVLEIHHSLQTDLLPQLNHTLLPTRWVCLFPASSDLPHHVPRSPRNHKK